MDCDLCRAREPVRTDQRHTEDATASAVPDASIEVDDVDVAHAAAQRLGCEILHPLTDEPWGVRRFFVRDPTGKALNVLSQPLTNGVTRHQPRTIAAPDIRDGVR